MLLQHLHSRHLLEPVLTGDWPVLTGDWPVLTGDLI